VGDTTWSATVQARQEGTTMSDTSQDRDAGVQEGGYGYPTLEQEVTPEVLEAGAQPAGSGDSEDSDDDEPNPGELEEDPSAVEPTD
jgi:hypothetical protein